MSSVARPDPEASRSGFSVWEDISVRFRDTDAMGHVNNAVYLTYLEVGRQAYWRRFSARTNYEQVPFVLAHACLDFRAEARVGEVIRVFLRTNWVSRRSFGMEYELRERESGRLAVTGETVQVTYDYEAKRSIPVPDWLRQELERIEGRPLPSKPPSP
ncbi:MAG TPA: thioesterase family protein [Candidatus Krumholzibacteria bacterium]|nr:thioesterase family protein [Candidatus Krumholzibacteria bacterium]